MVDFRGFARIIWEINVAGAGKSAITFRSHFAKCPNSVVYIAVQITTGCRIMSRNKERPLMQRDLADLPPPRFVYDTPLWLRLFMTALLALGAVLGLGLVTMGLSGDGHGWPAVAAGTIAAVACGSMMFMAKPLDGRRWINLAADREGVYFVGRGQRIVFVPWDGVVDIAVETRFSGKGTHSYAVLSLQLADEVWPRLSRFAAIEGRGPVRRYILPALAMPGEQVAAHLRDLRGTP